MEKTFDIEVSYSPGISERMDSLLTKTARHFGGSLSSSGCALFDDRERDLTFSFKTKAKAEAFFDEVLAMHKKQQQKKLREAGNGVLSKNGRR